MTCAPAPNTPRISVVVADAAVAVVLEVATLSLTLVLNRDDAVLVLSQLARAVLLVHGPTAVDEATKPLCRDLEDLQAAQVAQGPRITDVEAT